MASVRTSTHVYPQEEINAMMEFYAGKRCVVQRMENHVEWSHILDAALHPSNDRLTLMLSRKLRQDRQPRHAAEVRQNIVPLKIEHHRSIDEHPVGSTLFLHEDLLARTLVYERDVQQWRISETNAGRGDPGRPEYEEAFGGISITQHRYHAGGSLSPFLRNTGNDNNVVLQTYTYNDCPGIDSNSTNPFPIINTLLSIPFSLLHTLPRLAGILPLSKYQQQLITAGSEIIYLWFWDPPETIVESNENRISAVNQDDSRSAKPHPICHPSRDTTTFSTINMVSSSIHNLNQDPHIIELSSGQVLIDAIPSLSRDKDGLLTVKDDGLAGMEGVYKGIPIGVTISPATSLSCQNVHTKDMEFFSQCDDDDDDDDDSTDKEAEERLGIGCSSPDIMVWREKVVNSETEPLPLTTTFFERGVIGGPSANDALMIEGLIDPCVYIHFLDLSSFSCS